MKLILVYTESAVRLGRTEGADEPHQAWSYLRRGHHGVALVAPDPRHSSAGEERTWLVGESDSGVLVVVFTVREAAP
jgi:hypothetical protein